MARSITNGVIEEIEYRDGKRNGWGRIINSRSYSMGWFNNNKQTGYQKVIYNSSRIKDDDKDNVRIVEGIFEEDGKFNTIATNQVLEDMHLTQMRRLMEFHEKYFIKNLL